MKKTLLILTLSIISLTCIFAETTTGNLHLSAYKEQQISLPTGAVFSVTVTSNTNQEVPYGKIIDVTKDVATNRTINNAFSITIVSNYKQDTVLDLEFTPFVNQNNANKKVGLTYNYSTEPYVTVAGSKIVNDWCTCRYTPEAYLTNKVTSISVPSSATTVTTTLTQRVAKIEKRNKGWKSFWSEPEWGVYTDYEYSSDDFLPSFQGTEAISTTSNFSLTVSETDYNNMDVNTDYLASVKITFTIA